MNRRGASGGRPAARRWALVHVSGVDCARVLWPSATWEASAAGEFATKKKNVKKTAERDERLSKSIVPECEGGGGVGEVKNRREWTGWGKNYKTKRRCRRGKTQTRDNNTVRGPP